MVSGQGVASGALYGDILFVTRKWAPAMGGMETYSLKLTEQLARRHPVDVIALHGRSNGLPPRLASLLCFPITVMRGYFSRRHPPAVLHLGDMAIWPLGLLIRLRGGGTRVVLSAHGTDVSYPRRGGIRGRLYGAYLRLGSIMLPGARVITNSSATAEVVQENGWRNPIVIPLATDMVGTELDGSDDGTILFAGRLIKRKGCAWFIREVLPELPPGMRLQVAGTVWDDDERSALDSSQVTFLGNLEPADLRQAFARAFCVIVPNISMPNGEYEGFGLIAAEAAAAGGLVLASDHGGLRDAVIDGQTGFLVAADDADAWRRKIIEVRTWPPSVRKRFLDSAMQRAREHYSWERVAADTLAVYDCQLPAA